MMFIELLKNSFPERLLFETISASHGCHKCLLDIVSHFWHINMYSLLVISSLFTLNIGLSFNI